MRQAPIAAFFALAVVAGLASAQSAPHGPDGYRNNYPHEARASFWAWQWERLRDGVPVTAAGRLESSRGQDGRRSAALGERPIRR